MLTAEQQTIVKAASQLAPRETLKIEACAGSGKTSVLIEIAKANPQARFLYLAFNRSIVAEAKERFPQNVKIYTTHGLAYYWYAYTYGTKRLQNIKPTLRIFDLKEIFQTLDNKELNQLLLRWRAFCCSAAKEPTDEQMAAMFQAVQDGRLPMTHDFYLKCYQLFCKPKFRNYEYVLLDEAQDSNAVTLAVFTDNNCRRILVGDSHQSIYGFRGSINAMSIIAAERTLHLSRSFRTVQPILDQANFFLRRFASDKDSVVPMTSGVLQQSAEKQSFAKIFRTNAAIISELDAMAQSQEYSWHLQRPADAIFSCALSLLAFKERRFKDLGPTYGWLKRFQSLENLEDYAEECADVEILQNLKLLKNPDLGSKLPQLYAKAERLAANVQSRCVLTTAHSAKGLEWDNVTLADDFPDLAEAYEKSGQKKKRGERSMTLQEFEQELNLYYVALTRAKYDLIDLSPNGKYYASYC